METKLNHLKQTPTVTTEVRNRCNLCIFTGTVSVSVYIRRYVHLRAQV